MAGRRADGGNAPAMCRYGRRRPQMASTVFVPTAVAGACLAAPQVRPRMASTTLLQAVYGRAGTVMASLGGHRRSQWFSLRSLWPGLRASSIRAHGQPAMPEPLERATPATAPTRFMGEQHDDRRRMLDRASGRTETPWHGGGSKHLVLRDGGLQSQSSRCCRPSAARSRMNRRSAWSHGCGAWRCIPSGLKDSRGRPA